MNSLLNVRRFRARHPLGERLEGHLSRLALAHEHHGAAGQQGLHDELRVTFRHSVEQCHHGRQDGLLLCCCGV
jgi:hypothetical protein